MLGVSQAATIGINFQAAYSSPSYTGSTITATAFGIPPSGWESLTPMPTGYGTDPGPFSFTEAITTTTLGNGLHPLPKGALSVSWSAYVANVSGYHGRDVAYGGNGYHSGEQQVYWGFLRDGVTFGPGNDGKGTNDKDGYSVDITGLKSLFTGSSYVVQTIAATDSGFGLTNVFLIDPATHTTNSIAYVNVAPPDNLVGDVPFPRGIMGGTSEASVALSADRLQIVGNRASHGTDFNNSSTISAIIITDVPLIEHPPATPTAPLNTGDSTTLTVEAIGVPPLKYQWRKNGTAIANATNATYAIASVGSATAGQYDVVVSNAYGSATSSTALVTDGTLIGQRTGIIVDSKTNGIPTHGDDFGTSWAATFASRTGVAQFPAQAPGHIVLPASTNFDSPVGTISFWVNSGGTDTTDGLTRSASLFNHREGDGLDILQNDDGTVDVQVSGSNNSFTSTATISDSKWHLITITYDQSDTGFVSLYIDGIADSGNTVNGAAWSWKAGQPTWLGASRRGLWRPYVGGLDDVRVYDRILTDAEILLLSTNVELPVSTGLQVRFNFDTAPVSGLSVGWLSGNLRSSDTVTGPYAAVPVTSPYAVLPKAAAKFFNAKP
jgi:hypothetical protein